VCRTWGAFQEFYTAQLTITVFARSKEVCDNILDTVAYAASCIENEYVDTAVVATGDAIELDEDMMRKKLENFNIDPKEVGL